MDNLEKKNKKEAVLSTFKFKIALITIITIVSASSLTFGFFYIGKSQSGTSGMTTKNCFDMGFSDSNSINLQKAMPISDEDGQALTPYTFTITNKCSEASNYYVILNIKTGSLSENFVDLTYDDGEVTRISSLPLNTVIDKPTGYDRAYIISRGTLEQGKDQTHYIRMWLDKDTTYDDVKGGSWEAQVQVVSVVKELDDLTNPMPVDPAKTTLAKLGKTVKEGSPNFAEPATSDETADGLYAMEDDYGTSYYYRGAVEDNYVKFAEFYWRIIRINGDGSLRLIYDGTSAHANSDTSTDRLVLQEQIYNANYNDAKYVGYMYGPSGTTASKSKEEAQTNTASSDIKTAIESWYKTNIADRGYDEYVSDNIFCNDRSTPGREATGWSADTGLGYGTNVTGYGGYARLSKDQNNPSPKIECENKNDAFTKEDIEKGNGKLGEKVGMITADEIVLAGSGKYNTENQSYYLHKGNWYWSLSPHNVDTGGYARVFIVRVIGSLNNHYINNAGGVAPVINLGAEYVNTMVGNGSMSSPFEVK